MKTLIILLFLLISPACALEGWLKQSTAVNVTVLMIDSADHYTGKTGLTLTIYATKAGGTPTAITPTVTQLDATNVKGVYKLVLTTTDTNTLGELQLHVTGTGADQADFKWQITANLPDDLATAANVTAARDAVIAEIPSLIQIGEVVQVIADTITALLRGDWVIDSSAVPFRAVIYEEGTYPDAPVELLSQDMIQRDGGEYDAWTDTVRGRKKTP